MVGTTARRMGVVVMTALICLICVTMPAWASGPSNVREVELTLADILGMPAADLEAIGDKIDVRYEAEEAIDDNLEDVPVFREATLPTLPVIPTFQTSPLKLDPIERPASVETVRTIQEEPAEALPEPLQEEYHDADEEPASEPEPEIEPEESPLEQKLRYWEENQIVILSCIVLLFLIVVIGASNLSRRHRYRMAEIRAERSLRD